MNLHDIISPASAPAPSFLLLTCLLFTSLAQRVIGTLSESSAQSMNTCAPAPGATPHHVFIRRMIACLTTCPMNPLKPAIPCFLLAPQNSGRPPAVLIPRSLDPSLPLDISPDDRAARRGFAVFQRDTPGSALYVLIPRSLDPSLGGIPRRHAPPLRLYCRLPWRAGRRRSA